MATKKKRFPKRELNTWLRKHLTWNHEEWLKLIDDLKTQGFDELTSTQEGLDAIALYLETKQKSA